MRLLHFSRRVAKEVLRDPLALAFGLGFPLVVLLLLSAIQSNVPVPLFEITSLAPAIPIFGLSFFSLFSALLISRDRCSSLLQRLYTTPLRAWEYILGYLLPLLPAALAQGLVTYGAALLLGLPLRWTILGALLLLLPAALFFLALGLLCGSLLNDKQVGGFCGALLTNLTAWLSGIWFDLKLVGGWFEKLASVLPFLHAVELERAVYAGDYGAVLPHLLWVLGWTVAVTVLAVLAFLRQMRRQ